MKEICMSAAPIACMLSGNDFEDRLKWMADLNRQAFVRSERDDLSLTLTYIPGALHQVRQMVDQEQACCPFLSFEIAERHDGVVVVIKAPEDAREMADTVFAPFLQNEARKSGYGCCGGAA